MFIEKNMHKLTEFTGDGTIPLVIRVDSFWQIGFSISVLKESKDKESEAVSSSSERLALKALKIF